MNKCQASLLAVVIAALISLGLPQSTLAKGSPNRVEVIQAEPPELFQGQEEDVTVTGSGFDAGSDVSYLVTGTTDASQVEVLSVEYISDTELKTRIRPKDNALATDYDIEVRTSSGRKGKGTTLFKVKATETACTGAEDPSPTIAYLSELVLTPDIGTADLYLASESGCDQYLLLEDADETIFTTESFVELSSPWALRFDYERVSDSDGNEGQGIAIWRNISRTHGSSAILALSFLFDGKQVLVNPAGPQMLYVPPDDWIPQRWDVRIDDAGSRELVTVEAPLDEYEESDAARLVYIQLDDNAREVVLEGSCPIVDPAGECYRVSSDSVWWSEDGTGVYFEAQQWPEGAYWAIARMRRDIDEWMAPEVLIVDENDLDIMGIRFDDMLSYRRLEIEYRKNGRVASRKGAYSVIDPAFCESMACSAADGVDLPVSGDWVHGLWTRDGGLLYSDYDGNKRMIRKFWSTEFSIAADFQPIGPIHNTKWQCDTSF